jgi:glycosyltransferase involved in cell wall biosynthesis
MTFVNESSFVKRDIEILEENYIVSKFHFFSKSKILLPFIFLKQFFNLLFSLTKLKAIVIQSAGYHSFQPVIFGLLFKIPVIIIAIGNESIKLPEINYGVQRKLILSWFVNFSLRNARLILPVHKSLEYCEYNYSPVKFKKQGIRAFNTKIKTEIIEMVNGYNSEKWKITKTNRKDFTFLTVSDTIDETRYFIKGIDLIENMALTFPHYHFTIVGRLELEKDFPENINFIDRIKQNELLSIYNANKYYLQLSMSEGFPNALSEAMLCGCIPIGSNVGGISDIIGEKGFVLKEKKLNDLKSILSSLTNQDFSSNEVRNQITSNFPLDRRKNELLAHIEKL